MPGMFGKSVLEIEDILEQWSLTFLTPVTGFMEDSFSKDQDEVDGFRMIQTQLIQAHLLLCGPVPNKPRLVLPHSLEVGDPCFRGMSWE